MEKDKKSKLYEMLKNMSAYSAEQPKAIQDLCYEAFIPSAYAPAIDLIVESFLTVHSFVILMFEGLISNASAVLRILIEQVAAASVICRNTKAMMEYLRFQNMKKDYYASTGEKHEIIRNTLFQMAGYKRRNEGALKDYLDYGWIRIVNDNKSERGDKLIIKEARLEEMIVDIEEQLNAFAHGQRSSFEFLRNKDLSDKHVSRIIMAAGKLFLFLCYAKHEFLVNNSITNDKYFDYYLNAKILYIDLNARATNKRIVDIIQTTDNLDRDIVYLFSTLNHNRGMMYQSELNYLQVNMAARAYVLGLINFMFMICYKLFSNSIQYLLKNVNSFKELVDKVGVLRIDNVYKNVPHLIPLNELFKMTEMIDDKWSPMNSDGAFAELDENYITDFTSLVHSLFGLAYADFDKEELLKSFVPID